MKKPEIIINNIRLEYNWVKCRGSEIKQGILTVYNKRSYIAFLTIPQTRLSKMTLTPLLRGICGLNATKTFFATERFFKTMNNKIDKLDVFIYAIDNFNKYLEKQNAKL